MNANEFESYIYEIFQARECLEQKTYFHEK